MYLFDTGLEQIRNTPHTVLRMRTGIPLNLTLQYITS